MLPSPVFCRHPASAAPRLSASTALPDSDPKLIPEMLTTESGRKACRRPRAAPSTLAHGSQASCAGARVRGRHRAAERPCLTIT